MSDARDALAERGAVAEGVPREPTQAMIDIGRHFVGPRERVAGFWRAMWDAAPRASEGKPLPTAADVRGILRDDYKLAAAPADNAGVIRNFRTTEFDTSAPTIRDSRTVEFDTAAPTDDAALIADIEDAQSSEDANQLWRLLLRCRTALAQPAITDAEARARYWQETAAHRGQSLGALHAQIERKDKALREIEPIYRGWCNFCKGSIENCERYPSIPCAAKVARAALSDTQEPQS